MPVKSPLYDLDFFAWSLEQAELLRAGKLAEADIEHIAEEIDSMVKWAPWGRQGRLKI